MGKKSSPSLPHSEAADSWSLGELLDGVILVASQFDSAFCWMWYKAQSKISCQKSNTFFISSSFYADDLACVTVPESFLVCCGWMWLLQFIHLCFLSTSRIFTSSRFSSLSHIFSPCIHLLKIHFSLTEHWPCYSCLHFSFSHILITMSIVPACLMWMGCMVSITRNKRDGD